MSKVRAELLRVFEAMQQIEEYEHPKSVGARVQSLLRCAATHLELEPLPGIGLGAGMGRLSPACEGCAGCPGRKALLNGREIPEGMTKAEEHDFYRSSRADGTWAPTSPSHKGDSQKGGQSLG